MLKVKFFQKWVKSEGHEVKKMCFQQKGLATRNTHVKYESPIYFGSKVIAKVIFFLSKAKVKVRVTKSKIIASTERSCYKKYTCEI